MPEILCLDLFCWGLSGPKSGPISPRFFFVDSYFAAVTVPILLQGTGMETRESLKVGEGIATGARVVQPRQPRRLPRFSLAPEPFFVGYSCQFLFLRGASEWRCVSMGYKSSCRRSASHPLSPN